MKLFAHAVVVTLGIGIAAPSLRAGPTITQTYLGSFPATFNGTLPNQDTALVQRFTLASSTNLTITITSYALGGFQPNLFLYDSAGNFITAGSPSGAADPNTGIIGDSRLIAPNLAAGMYQLAVTDFKLNQSITATNLSDGFTANFGSGTTFSDSNGNQRTGAFAFTITGPGASQVPEPAISPVSGTGTSMTRTFVFTDADGADDIGVVNVLVNFYLDGRNSCYVAYDSVGNVIYLVQNDGGTLQGLALPSAGTLSNTQCSIPAGSITAIKSGNTLRLIMTINFLGSYGGTRVVFAAARDRNGGNSGWLPVGQQTISTPTSNPLPLSISPLSGTAVVGITYPVTVSYRDATASTSLQPVQVLINNALDGRSACYVGFDHGGNVLYLVDDLGRSLLPTAIRLNGAAGGASSMENTQCKIIAAGSTFTESGQTMTMTLQIQFKAPFVGRRLVYAGAQSTDGANSGWTVPGALTVQ